MDPFRHGTRAGRASCPDKSRGDAGPSGQRRTQTGPSAEAIEAGRNPDEDPDNWRCPGLVKAQANQAFSAARWSHMS